MGRRQKLYYTSIALRLTHSTVRLCIVNSTIFFLLRVVTSRNGVFFFMCNDMNQLTRVLRLVLVTFAETPVSLTIAINVLGNFLFQKNQQPKNITDRIETPNIYRTKNTTCSDWQVFHGGKPQEVIYHKLPYLATTLTTINK